MPGLGSGEDVRDTHSDNFEGTPQLQSKGLLGQTLLVLGTEFGRTPRITDDDGREHCDKASKCLLTGLGIWTGNMIGRAVTMLKATVERKYNCIVTIEYCHRRTVKCASTSPATQDTP